MYEEGRGRGKTEGDHEGGIMRITQNYKFTSRARRFTDYVTDTRIWQSVSNENGVHESAQKPLCKIGPASTRTCPNTPCDCVKDRQNPSGEQRISSPGSSLQCMTCCSSKLSIETSGIWHGVDGSCGVRSS